MASKRIAIPLLRYAVASRTVAPRRNIPQVGLCSSLKTSQYNTQLSWGTIRHHSTPAAESKIYNFEDIKSFLLNPSPDRILVDVREPGEFRDGAIPTAINVPIATVPGAWSLSVEEFEDLFGFAKPETERELVFYCKAGVRSSAAAQLALQNGYEKVGEYRGSWLEWEKKMGV